MKSITESESNYHHLEQKPLSVVLQEINAEDQKVALAVQQVLPAVEQLTAVVVERMTQGGRLFYIGAGTSGRLGVLDASEIPPTYGMPQGRVIGLIAGGDDALRLPVEHAEDDTEQGWKDLQMHQIGITDVVVGLAASGTTPYVIAALAKARTEGIFTGCVTCNPGSPLSKVVDVPIEPAVGPEYVTGSTRMKSGTAEKMILNMISTAAMIQLGRVKGNRMVNMQLTNAKLIDRGTRMIMDELGLDYEAAKHLLEMHGSVKKVLEMNIK